MEMGPILIIDPSPGPAAAVGAWIRTGSAHEPRELAGVTHLLEHLSLRRSGGRGPDEIAELIDSLGGAVDAFTTRETCAITAHVPAQRSAEALDLVLGALFDPRFNSSDVELEQHVIEAEFDLVQDSPAEVAAERALEACWGEHPLARPVLGSLPVVKRLALPDLKRFHAERFTRDRLLLVAVGAFDESALLDALSRYPSASEREPVLVPPAWRTGMLVERRDGLEQIYANLVLPGLPSNHPEGMTLGVLHQLLGAGNSSRLFRELRDRLGLVYEVESSLFGTENAGLLEVVFSCPVRQALPCWDAVLRVLGEIAGGGITDREVSLAKQALAAGLILSTESVDAVMEAHAGEYLARRRRFDGGVLLAELEAVTAGRVRALARELVRLDLLAGAVCGPREGMVLPASLARRVA
jgi:predicted Zn-dependent peptidase